MLVSVLKDTFKARIDKLSELGPILTVTGDVKAPTTDWAISLDYRVPQGYNNTILWLNIISREPTGTSGDVPTIYPVRYEEEQQPPLGNYFKVEIFSEGPSATDSFTVEVQGDYTIAVMKDTFKTRLDKKPGLEPTLIVTGEVKAPTTDWEFGLRYREPQGVDDPAILALEIIGVRPTGVFEDVPTIYPIRYEETPYLQDYHNVVLLKAWGSPMDENDYFMIEVQGGDAK